MSKTTNKYSREVRERAVRMVLDNPGLDVSRFDAAPLIAFTATKETNHGHGKNG